MFWIVCLLFVHQCVVVDSFRSSDDKCFARYAHHLRAIGDPRISLVAQDRAPRLPQVADVELQHLLSRKSMLIDASPGSTGTHGLASYLSSLDTWNMSVLHWAECFSPERSSSSLSLSFMSKRCTYNAVDECGRRCRLGFSERRYNLREMLVQLPPKSNVEPRRWVESAREMLERGDTLRALASFDALTDAPFNHYFYFVYRLFPRAYVMLTDRDAAEWAAKRARGHGAVPTELPFAHRHRDYGVAQFDKRVNARLFNAHMRFVECLVPRDRLLRINLFEQRPRDIADTLHSFVGRHVPHVAAAPPFTDAQLKHIASTSAAQFRSDWSHSNRTEETRGGGRRRQRIR
jgi:Sulfotransferase domain